MARSICEVPIRNVNRERGVSHYGITRTFRVFFDLLTIRFLLRYLSRPLHFFGSFGMMSIFGGSGDRARGWAWKSSCATSPSWPNTVR